MHTLAATSISRVPTVAGHFAVVVPWGTVIGNYLGEGGAVHQAIAEAEEGVEAETGSAVLAKIPVAAAETGVQAQGDIGHCSGENYRVEGRQVHLAIVAAGVVVGQTEAAE